MSDASFTGGHQQANPLDLQAEIKAAQDRLDALRQQEAMAHAVDQMQSAVHKDVPLEAGEWQYTVKVGDVLRFPASVRKVEG